MNNITIKKYKIIAIIAILFSVFVDQAIKIIVDNSMQVGDTIPIIPEVLHITYVLNDGAAFSMLSGQAWILCGFTSVILGVLVYLLISKMIKHPLAIWSVSLVISGGVGNLIDRVFRGEELFYGKVIDYIDFRIINFAVFNFADCCVVIGTILLSAYLIFFENKKDKEEKTEALQENQEEDQNV